MVTSCLCPSHCLGNCYLLPRLPKACTHISLAYKCSYIHQRSTNYIGCGRSIIILYVIKLYKCSHPTGHSQVAASIQSQSVPIKMRSVLCGAVVLCLLQCCTAVPLEEFVGYPFSNETHQVYRLPPYYSRFPVNISQPFVIDGRGMTGFYVSQT